MRNQDRFIAATGILATAMALSISQAHSKFAAQGGAQVEVLPAATITGRMKPEPPEKDTSFNRAEFLRARQQAIQKAAPRRTAPATVGLELSPRSPFKSGAGYLKFDLGFLDARESTFGMVRDSWVHVVFNTKAPSRQILLLINGDVKKPLKLSWGANRMSTFNTALPGTGSKAIPLIFNTEAPGKYTIVFRVNPESTQGVPFVFRSVEIIDLT